MPFSRETPFKAARPAAASGEGRRHLCLTPRRLAGQRHDPGNSALPPGGPFCLADRPKLNPVVGVSILWSAIWIMDGRGAKEVEVDAVHGFRPGTGIQF